ncbi:MAG: hypothetical protein QME46_00025 [Thermoanaerobacteraceae bacterium]|nr:hypothetical protein [Thermoanaerobacteraceae bacterium]
MGVSYKYLKKLTDNTGILQFAKYDEPLKESGYTVDDNARALLVAVNMDETKRERFTNTYITFLMSAQRQDGSFINLKVGNTFLPTIDSEDSIGRAFMACCYILGDSRVSDNVKKMSGEIVESALPLIPKIKSLRAVSYILMGLITLITSGYNHRTIYKLAGDIAQYLKKNYRENKTDTWKWFEEWLTYCNAVLPHSLFSYYTISSDRDSLNIAEESLGFLTDSLFKNGYLSIVGNRGWWQRNRDIPPFDQQPVDAASIVLACLEGYLATRKREYLAKATLSYEWYWGKNIHRLNLYNENSGGCHDALVPDGLNMNQGAEAIVTFLLTYQMMNEILEEKEEVIHGKDKPHYIPAV